MENKNARRGDRMLMTGYHGCSSVCGTMQASSSTDRLQVCGGWIYVSPRRDEGIAPYKSLWQYRIILSADTASEVRQLLSQKRR